MEKQILAVGRGFVEKLPARGAESEALPNNQRLIKVETDPYNGGEFITLQEDGEILGVVIRGGKPYYELAGQLVPVVGVVKKDGYGFVPVLGIELAD